MKISIWLKWTLLIIGTLWIVSSFTVILFLIPELLGLGSYLEYTPSINNYFSQSLISGDLSVESIKNITQKKQLKPGIPIRLKIPAINVDATIESVGITPQGEMAVAKGYSNVAWFNLGARPGTIGSAVVVWHYGWEKGIPTVFNKLHTLSKGDKLSIEDESGTTIVFIVRELRTYGQDDDTTWVFDSSDGKVHLNLITCQGIWNKIKESYPDRLVVFADKEI